jgi:hypothetical protein
MEIANRTTAEVLKHHLDVLGEGKVDETVLDYAPEAVIITPGGLVKGQAEIRKFFTHSVANVLPPGSDFKMIEMVVEGELAYILWSAESPFYSIPFGTDTFVIRAGLIVGQTFSGQLNKKE